MYTNFLVLILSLALIPVTYMIMPVDNEASGRCPNGYHKDESGECEKVVGNKGKPRCPNGYHRSPDGDCEKVSSGKSSTSKKSDSDHKKSTTNENKKIDPKITSEGIEISGPVTHVADGDTLDVNGITIRLALVNTPEIGENGYESAKNFVKDLCLGKNAQVDIDDGQRGGDRYGREVGVVYCDGVNVNSALMEKQYARIYTSYCDVSEFANASWADCSSMNTQLDSGTVTKHSASDNADLDCSDFDKKNFKVQPGDPYGLDRDGDGIACEG